MRSVYLARDLGWPDGPLLNSSCGLLLLIRSIRAIRSGT